mgnify:CR=1 FL=1
MALEREMPDVQASHARRVWTFEYPDGERVVGVADEVGCIHSAVPARALSPCPDPAWASLRGCGGWVPVSA